ncbi:MAG: Terminase-like family protein, partial [Oscillospiraceae bacterium]|nr:Terminase-like family protein [Oscillospiraceae bacterium]
KAWLEGNWDIFEGQFFEEFTIEPDILKCEQLGISPEQAKKERRLTHVIEPFEIPKGWKIYRSFDWGFAKPFSCDWWALDYDGRAYLILQLYGCTGQANEGLKWTPDRVFREIRKIENEHRWLKGNFIQGVADPAIWNAETGESIAETAERYMVYFDKGDHARIPGWMQVHYRLQFDEEGLPMVYFFNTCEHAIRTLPLLQFDEHRVEDLDSRGEDHFADSMRYFFMTRPITPPAETDTAKDYDANPLNLTRGWYK